MTTLCLHPWILNDIIYCDLKLKFFIPVYMYFHALLATLQLREFKSEANDIAMKFLPAQFPLGVSMCA